MAEFNARRRLSRMRRGVVSAANLLQRHREAEGRYWAAFLTLTYRPGVEWHRSHIRQFNDCVRKYLGRLGVRYERVWVLELTRAGRPHYHVMIWLRRGIKLPLADEAGWWPHGMTRTEKARNAVGYLVKYASKGTSVQDLPKGARIFGTGGLTPHARLLRSWETLPKYIRSRSTADDKPQRCPGGGWVCLATGEWLPAARLVLHADGSVEVRPPP